jgi:hypothetical protein
MAVTFASDTIARTSTLVADYPENIILDPLLNGRYERDTPEVKAAVLALAADIAAHGQHTPVKFRKNDAGKPVLVFGYCRWHAVNHLNKQLRAKGASEDQLFKVEGGYEKLDEQGALIAAIGENRFRIGTSPMDDCWNITLLATRWKKSDEDIALIYFPDAKGGDKKAAAVAWVKARAALAELADEAQDAVNKGEIKVTTAVKLAQVPKEEQKKIIAENTTVVKGKKRLKVAAVIASTGKGKTAEKAKAQVQAQKDKKAGKKPSAPAPAPVSVQKVSSTVYQAAENLARAVEAWNRNEPKADKHLITALHAYRQLVPFKKAASEAAA